MPKVTLAVLVSALAILSKARESYPKTFIAELATINGPSNHVELTGRIIAAVKNKFTLQDATGLTLVNARGIVGWTCGDDVCIQAYKKPQGVFAFDIKVLRQGSPMDVPPVLHLDSAQLSGDRYNFRLVSVCGTITGVYSDELDARWVFITLETEDTALMLSAFYLSDAERQRLVDLVDMPVRATGICVPNASLSRKFLSHTIFVDPFRSLQPISDEVADKAGLPHRQSVAGTVLARCDAHSFYLKTTEGEYMRIHAASGTPMPNPGTSVKVSGFVRHNIFFRTFSNSLVTPAVHPPSNETLRSVSARELLYAPDGTRMIKAEFEGRPIRLSGRVINASESGTENAHLTLDCDGISVPVRVGILPPPDVGSEVEVSGICSITSESDGNPYGFVRLTGFTLLTRGPEDVVILKNPPWWTPAKMLAVIAALLLLVVGILIWNKSLRTLAERRGRELMAEQIGHVSADLKVNERTRLAVELHDALSQNLTGVSLQLDAVKRFADEDRGKMTRHLDMAMRTLKSCRDELRNCLWDLRNRALEEKDMNEAIRKTVSPFVGEAKLLIRFNLPRAQISDDTAHALMRIIRELASNAVRHGQAKTIRIAGAIENGRLLFSVNDDGYGFDPENHPGVGDGHFGLEGIRERIGRFGGTMDVASVLGKGTTVKLSLPA